MWRENKLGDQRERRCVKRERRLMGKSKRRRARGINSGSSQFRVTPQLIVQVRWSQVSSSNRRPLGITAVTEQLRPPSLSSIFHRPASSLSKQSSFSHRRIHQSKKNVTLSQSQCVFEALQTFYNTGSLFLARSDAFI